MRLSENRARKLGLPTRLVKAPASIVSLDRIARAFVGAYGMGAGIAQIPEVVGAGITSYAGGSAGHDPIKVAAGAKAQGLTPNVHITCVNREPADVARALDDLIALGIENVFAISGDYPKGAPLGSVGFACDSVQLVETIAEQRAQGKWPFYVSVAVSPLNTSKKIARINI